MFRKIPDYTHEDKRVYLVNKYKVKGARPVPHKVPKEGEFYVGWDTGGEGHFILTSIDNNEFGSTYVFPDLHNESEYAEYDLTCINPSDIDEFIPDMSEEKSVEIMKFLTTPHVTETDYKMFLKNDNDEGINLEEVETKEIGSEIASEDIMESFFSQIGRHLTEGSGDDLKYESASNLLNDAFDLLDQKDEDAFYLSFPPKDFLSLTLHDLSVDIKNNQVKTKEALTSRIERVIVSLSMYLDYLESTKNITKKDNE